MGKQCVSAQLVELEGYGRECTKFVHLLCMNIFPGILILMTVCTVEQSKLIRLWIISRT